jgi:hypothetical protein
MSGGLIAEIIHISTGDPNRPYRAKFLPLFLGILLYYLVTRHLRNIGKIK